MLRGNNPRNTLVEASDIWWAFFNLESNKPVQPTSVEATYLSVGVVRLSNLFLYKEKPPATFTRHIVCVTHHSSQSAESHAKVQYKQSCPPKLPCSKETPQKKVAASRPTQTKKKGCYRPRPTNHNHNKHK